MNININPNSELNQSIVNVPDMVQVPEVWIHQAHEFQRVMMMYACAIREVKTKLEVLNDELSVKNQRNPIEMIKSRVKKPMSILEKLQRRGFEVSLESMRENLDDVAGIRIICSFLDDIYEVAEMLVRQDDVKVIAVKDYIKNPKPNGYRSYHLVIEHAGGGSDPHHRHGFLGQPGSSAQVQEIPARRQRDQPGVKAVRGCDRPDRREDAGDPPEDRGPGHRGAQGIAHINTDSRTGFP